MKNKRGTEHGVDRPVFDMNRRAVLSAFAAFTTFPVVSALAQTPAADPLPSWNDTALDAAQAMGWTVVDMKNDWNKIFPFGSK